MASIHKIAIEQKQRQENLKNQNVRDERELDAELKAARVEKQVSKVFEGVKSGDDAYSQVRQLLQKYGLTPTLVPNYDSVMLELKNAVTIRVLRSDQKVRVLDVIEAALSIDLDRKSNS